MLGADLADPALGAAATNASSGDGLIVMPMSGEDFTERRRTTMSR